MIFPCVGFVRGLLMSDDELRIVRFLFGRFFECGGIEGPGCDNFCGVKEYLDDGFENRCRMLDVSFSEGRLCLVFFGFCDDFKVVDELRLNNNGASNSAYGGFIPDGHGSVLVECVIRAQVELWRVVDFDGLWDVVVGGLVASEGCVS